MNVNLQSSPSQRLLLLAAIAGLGLCALTARLGVLTLAKGDDLREEADARLVREQWTPTVRGRILDRKGRVVAQDRPSYAVALQYNVLAGKWAPTEAQRAARRLAGVKWGDMSPDEREALIAHVQRAYEAHEARAWQTLADTLGLSQQELRERAIEAARKVQARQRQVTDRRVAEEIARANERGEELSATEQRKLLRVANEPIIEMKRPHRIAEQVSDSVGFACQSLATHTVQLELLDDSADLDLARWSLPSDRVENVPAVPGLVVLDSGLRDYPLDIMTVDVDTSTFPGPLRSGVVPITVEGVACHLIGRLRDQVYPDETRDGRVIPGDTTRRKNFLQQYPGLAAEALTPDGADRGDYREGDTVGEVGVEASQENILRGLRGLSRVQLDTGERTALAATPGRDVQLVLDMMLQARVQALLSPQAGLAVVQPWHGLLTTDRDNVPPMSEGTRLNGAVVVLDIASGDILAAVSSPTFSRQQLADNPASIYQDAINTPFLNRAIAAEYPPGSVVKPLVFVEANMQGKVGLDERIACNGHFLPNRTDMLRCLIYKRFGTTHSAKFNGPLDVVEAIGVSCNIYFYEMGDRLGAQGIEKVYRDFGVGSTFGIGAGYEAPGQLGGADALTISDARLMGIGQGPVTWTPMHAANTYATIARGGLWKSPRLVRGAPANDRQINLSSQAVAASLAGLDYSVNDPSGTGHHLGAELGRELIFSLPEGVKVWGKTGTATAPDLMVDPDGDGPAPRGIARAGDHSWFVVLAGRGKPEYAIATVMEYAGSGAKVSGPIINQVIAALEKEGYFGEVTQ